MKPLAIIAAVLLSAALCWAKPVLIVAGASGGGGGGAAPTMTSRTIDSTGLVLTTVFSEAVTGNTGITLTPSVGAAVTATYKAGSGTDTITWDLSREVSGAETITLSYTQAAGNLLDGDSNELANITDAAITNNGDDTHPIPPATVDTSEPSNMGDAADYSPANAAALTTALANCSDGDVIELTAGSTYTGHFTLRDRGTSGDPVIIRSSSYGSLPADVRVDSGDTANLATIQAGTSQAYGIEVENGAEGYRLVGLEVTKQNNSAPANYLLSIGEAGSSKPTSAADMPDNIIVDRCYIHGHTSAAIDVGVLMHGKNSAIIDSTIEDIQDTVSQAQGIWAYSGGQVVEIRNCKVTGSGMCIFTGGDDPANADVMPEDWTITRCHLIKPYTWWDDHGSYAGTDYNGRYLFEMKLGLRFLIEGNIIEQQWADNDAAVAIAIKSTNQGGGVGTFSETGHVMFRKNIIRECGIPIQCSGNPENPTDEVVVAHHVAFVNNLFYDIDNDPEDFGNIQKNLKQFTLEHNTFADSDASLTTHFEWAIDTDNYLEDLTIRDNVFAGTSAYGFRYANAPASDDGWDGVDKATNQLSSIFEYNLLVDDPNQDWTGSTSTYEVTTFANVDFNDAGNDDYSLKSSSDGYEGASDGTDCGYDKTAVDAATENCVSGDWSS